MARAICLLGTFATLFVNVPSLNAATVVSGGVIVSPDQEGGLGDYFFGVAQKADDVDPHDTRAWADIDFADHGVTLTGTRINLDEGSDWYFVRRGDVFGPRSGEESPYPQFAGWRNLELTEFVSGPVTFSPALDYANGLEDGPDDFYLGVATTNWFGDEPPPWPGRHIFGWVKLGLVEELGEYHLEQLESAVAFTCSGIVIGTLIAVPEPSTFLLALVALGVIGGWRKWKHA